MPSLKSIKNRISGVKSTKKITQAMKIVAASRLKKAKANVAKTKKYLETFDELLLNIYNTDESVFQESNPLYLQKKHDQQNILIVAFGSDRGLCGSFNSKIISAVANEITASSDQNIQAICIGDKISNYMNLHYKDNVEFSTSFTNQYNKTISYPHAVSLSQKIQKLFKDKGFSECKLVYTKFNSMMNQKVVNIKLLPLDMDYIADVKSRSNSNEVFEFDNNLSMILEQVLLNFISATIFHVYANSMACEYSTRMIAMDSATQNSEKMLKELSLIYNRSRQGLITKELIEIISGAEAIN